MPTVFTLDIDTSGVADVTTFAVACLCNCPIVVCAEFDCVVFAAFLIVDADDTLFCFAEAFRRRAGRFKPFIVGARQNASLSVVTNDVMLVTNAKFAGFLTPSAYVVSVSIACHPSIVDTGHKFAIVGALGLAFVANGYYGFAF